MKEWKIGTMLLALFINAVAWMVYLDSEELGGPAGIFIFFMSIIVLLFTAAGIVIAHLIMKSFRVREWLRWVIYAIPSLIVIGFIGVLSLFPTPDRPVLINQTDNAVSPSGLYRLSMPIDDHRQRVTISDNHGKVLYKDKDSDFSPLLSTYWIWDKKDRAWIYNSDDSSVYVWQKTKTGWTKTEWGTDRHKELKCDFAPPEALYPDYVK
jgi:hypothetical protein